MWKTDNKIKLLPLVVLLLFICVGSQAAQRAVIRPASVNLSVGQTQTLSLSARDLGKATKAVLYRRGKPSQDARITLACASATHCKLTLTPGRGARPGLYVVMLQSARGLPVASAALKVLKVHAGGRPVVGKLSRAASRRVAPADTVALRTGKVNPTRPGVGTRAVSAKPLAKPATSVADPAANKAKPVSPVARPVPKPATRATSSVRRAAKLPKAAAAGGSRSKPAPARLQPRPVRGTPSVTTKTVAKRSPSQDPATVKAQSNQAPAVNAINLPSRIAPGQRFTVTIHARDDKGVVAIAIMYNGKRQTLKAKPPYKTRERFSVDLLAPKRGSNTISVIALDTSRARSAVKKKTVTTVARTVGRTGPSSARTSAVRPGNGTKAPGRAVVASGNSPAKAKPVARRPAGKAASSSSPGKRIAANTAKTHAARKSGGGPRAVLAKSMDEVLAGSLFGLLIYPRHGDIFRGVNNQFKWKPVAGAGSYSVCIKLHVTDSGCLVSSAYYGTIAESGDGQGVQRTWSPPPAFYDAVMGQKLYWTVSICNLQNQCISPPAEAVKFALPAPTNLSPGGRVTPTNVASRRPTLSWGPVVGAERYHINLTASGSTQGFDTGNTPFTLPQPVSVLMQNPVSWRVSTCKSIDGTMVCSAYSPAMKLTINAASQEAIGTASLSQPAQNALVSVGQEFAWGSAANADSYKFCINKWHPSGQRPQGCSILRNISAGTSYQLDINTYNSLINQYSDSTNRITQAGPSLGNHMFVWSVLPCGLAGGDPQHPGFICGTPSTERQFMIAAGATRVKIQPPTLIAPVADAVVSESSPQQLRWSAVPGVDHYSVYIWDQTGSQYVHPDTGQFSSPGGNQSVITHNNQLNIPAGMMSAMSGHEVYFHVSACSSETGAHCRSSAETEPGGMRRFVVAGTTTPGGAGEATQAVTFNDLRPAFESRKCQNCHSVAADGFVSGGGADGIGLPVGHPSVNSGTDCMACHSGFLTPVNGMAEISLNWQAALASHQFAGASDLCGFGKTGAGGDDAETHLSEDRLILWAIYNGAWQGHGSGQAAVTAWKQKVHDWAAAGMPCN